MAALLRSLALRSPALRYGLCLASVVAATLVRLAMNPLLHNRQPYTIYFLAIVFGAWFGGRTAGLAATALSAALATVLFVQPTAASLHDPTVTLALSVFLLTGAVVSALSQSLLGAERQAQSAAGDVQRRDLALQEVEERLFFSEERQRLALEGARIGTWHWDLQRDELLWSGRCRAMFGLPPEIPITYDLFSERLHPDDRDRTNEAVRRSIADETDFEIEYRVVWPDDSVHWVLSIGRGYYDAQGAPMRFEGIVLDIDARKDAERAQQFLVDFTERTRALLDADAVLWETVSSLGDHFCAARCLYADIEADGMTGTFLRDYCPGGPSMAGAFALDAFGSTIAADLRTGCMIACSDIASDARTASDVAVYARLAVRSYFAMPIMSEGRLAALMIVAGTEPRVWSTTERALLETVAERAWLTVSNIRLLQATQQEVTERRRAQQALEEAYERESLVNKIGQSIRSSEDVPAIRMTTVAALGKALRADRCYFVEYDPETDTGIIDPDWHLGGLPSLAGARRMSDYIVNQDTGYWHGRTQVIDDVRERVPLGASLLEELGIRSLLRVPLGSAKRAAIGVAMTDGPRRWTLNEITLAETVAAQMQAALVTTVARQREERIASALEEALQPSVPDGLPGLTVAAHCKAALDEARIGGDFYDVFLLELGRVALVVGDVSGKGLAAAAQISTVRNMLRGALYDGRSVADAVTRLNANMTRHDLLSGFVTLFVGVYATDSRRLGYVSCGHEPAIVLRAGGASEQFGPTGLPLGVSEDEAYEQGTVDLGTGDLLLLYTDGVPEAGPTRAQQLGTNGVVETLRRHCSEVDLDRSVRAIGAAVDAHASGVLRDDICLLLTRFE